MNQNFQDMLDRYAIFLEGLKLSKQERRVISPLLIHKILWTFEFKIPPPPFIKGKKLFFIFYLNGLFFRTLPVVFVLMAFAFSILEGVAYVETIRSIITLRAPGIIYIPFVTGFGFAIENTIKNLKKTFCVPSTKIASIICR